MSPYVPSLKTDGKSDDRILIDAKVETLSAVIATEVNVNFDVLRSYQNAFYFVCQGLQDQYIKSEILTDGSPIATASSELARTIWSIGEKYGYQGAFLGELNYALTRLIQRVPQLMVASGKWAAKDEIRYWLYAVTVEALCLISATFLPRAMGIGGVLEDVKDEYKRRVNPSYEAAQIVKSGDCYDTPFYNRLVRVVDEDGKEVGKILVDMVRSAETLGKDVLDGELVLHTKVTA